MLGHAREAVSLDDGNAISIAIYKKPYTNWFKVTIVEERKNGNWPLILSL